MNHFFGPLADVKVKQPLKWLGLTRFLAAGEHGYACEASIISAERGAFSG